MSLLHGGGLSNASDEPESITKSTFLKKGGRKNPFTRFFDTDFFDHLRTGDWKSPFTFKLR